MIHKARKAWHTLRTQLDVILSKISESEQQAAKRYNMLAEKADLITHDVQQLSAGVYALKEKYDLPLCGESFRKHDGAKKQVLIIGWYGVENYGDELMLDTIYQALRTNTDIEISILVEKNENYNLEQWEGAHLYHFPEADEHIKAMASFYDELILGGGAHIDDKDISELSFVPYVARRLSLAMLDNKKSVKWIAVSSSKTLNNEVYINDLKKIIGSATVFSLRDTNSLSTLKEAGIDTKNITVVDDIAFVPVLDKKILGVTFIDYFNNRDALVKFCQDIITFAKQDTASWKICFLPFYNENDADKKLYEDIIGRVDWQGVEVFIAPIYKNISSMQLLLKACDVLVNMRYHATLLGLRMQIPTLSLCYDAHPHYYNKITYVHSLYHNDDIVYFSEYKVGDISKLLAKVRKTNTDDNVMMQKRATKELRVAINQ